MSLRGDPACRGEESRESSLGRGHLRQEHIPQTLHSLPQSSQACMGRIPRDIYPYSACSHSRPSSEMSVSKKGPITKTMLGNPTGITRVKVELKAPCEPHSKSLAGAYQFKMMFRQAIHSNKLFFNRKEVN